MYLTSLLNRSLHFNNKTHSIGTLHSPLKMFYNRNYILILQYTCIKEKMKLIENYPTEWKMDSYFLSENDDSIHWVLLGIYKMMMLLKDFGVQKRPSLTFVTSMVRPHLEWEAGVRVSQHWGVAVKDDLEVSLCSVTSELQVQQHVNSVCHIFLVSTDLVY